MVNWWDYDELPSGEPYDWGGAARGSSPYDNLDFHLDIGCGRLKKGRLGIDRFPDPGVDLCIDLERLLPAELAPGKWHEPTVQLYKGRAEAISHGVAEIPRPGLPFPDNSIESIISHHFCEHLGSGFVPLMDECHRILKPDGIFRIIVPLFPSHAAVADPDHKRNFCEGSFDVFCGEADGSHSYEEFSTPYTSCRFEKVDEDITARNPDPQTWWTPADRREMRVALRKRDLK